MRLDAIYATNIPPVKKFEVSDLSDVVVLAGPNGVGKTRLVNRLLAHLQSPQPAADIRLVITATTKEETELWSKDCLDTQDPEDCRKLQETLQRNTRRTKWRSSVLNIESDRTIQAIKPFSFSWDLDDPDEENISWDITFRMLRDRWQDTLHAIFKKVEARRRRLASRAENLLKDGKKSMDLSGYSDLLAPFKETFTQLLTPKRLLDVQPQKHDLFYEHEGTELSVSTLSGGEKEVLNIAFDFVMRSPSDCIIVFDEPELHLHPELTYKLIQTLKAIGDRNQFLFCTHSPDIITASLDHSVIFITPPKDDDSNQAMLATPDDETHLALKLLGQSIGIISLGRKIVLIEGESASLDKQVYGAILQNRFSDLVLVPSEGKNTISSFANIHEKVLSKTIWGVDFFMLCDRDVMPLSGSTKKIDEETSGRFRTLPRYHLENYFLNEHVWAEVFSQWEPDESWLRSPDAIRDKFREIARSMISYGTALIVKAEIRDAVGNVDLMPKASHDRTPDELKELFTELAQKEEERITAALGVGHLNKLIEDTHQNLTRSIEESGDRWKKQIPGKQLVSIFASEVGIDVIKLKRAYIKTSENIDPSPFQDIIDIFNEFSNFQHPE